MCNIHHERDLGWSDCPACEYYSEIKPRHVHRLKAPPGEFGEMVNILCIGLFTMLMILQLGYFFFSKDKFDRWDALMVFKVFVLYLFFCSAVLLLTGTITLPGMSGLR